MIRFLGTLLFLAIGIGLFLMAGSILLPVIGILFLIWFFAALFRPGRRTAPVQTPPEPAEDIPASQAVIDVEAVTVTDDDDPPAAGQGPR